MQHSMKRKHQLSEEPGPAVKKVRLDSLLLNLSLGSTKDAKDKSVFTNTRDRSNDALKSKQEGYSVNPMVDPTHPAQSSVDSYISEKLFQGFKDKFFHDHALIRWVPPLFVIAYHFERWVKRLFNQFVRRFNENNPTRNPVKRFTSYLKIMRLVQNPAAGITVEDLWNILMGSNLLEAKKLALKRDKRSDSKKVEEMHEEEQLARESQYGYWDRFRNFRADVVMEDSVYEALDMEIE